MSQRTGRNFSVELRRCTLVGAYYFKFTFDDVDIDHMFLCTFTRLNSTWYSPGIHFFLTVEECFNNGYEGAVEESEEETSHQSHDVLQTHQFCFAASMAINDWFFFLDWNKTAIFIATHLLKNNFNFISCLFSFFK